MTTVDRGAAIGFEQGQVLDPTNAGSEFPAIGGFSKRVFDVFAAAFMLFLLSPLFLFTAIAIRLLMPGPVLFGHERVGLGGRSFTCWKFRTMRVDGERVLRDYLDANPVAAHEWQTHRKLKSDPRVTPLGRVLREYSVDELPQLINVLRGEMSLVGPRPVVREELAYYGAEALRYASARPGITGLWQVSGRSDIDYARRVEMDTSYVEGWSFWSDAWILLQTIPAVLGARGSC